MKELKLFECYAGYGGAAFGLQKANINFKTVGFSEIKKSAIELYNLNHPNIKNYGDINKIKPKELPDFDIITGGFPCQDVSMAGLRDLSKGRTNTVFKMLEIIKVKKPKYCLLENVKGVLSMLDGQLIKEIVRQLKNIGYAVSYECLNSKNYGVPQNRERVWIVCELNKTPFGFTPFPKKETETLFVEDILEDKVGEEYYITNKQYLFAKEYLKKRNGQNISNNINKPISMCLTARGQKRSLHDVNLIIHSKQPRTNTSGKGGSGHLMKNDGYTYCLYSKNSQYLEYNKKLRVLTPRECFRLMGFFNDEINLNGISKNQLWEAAGNGWDVNLVSKIFSKWLK